MKMRNIRKVLLLSIILVITIGFAVISSNLKVNGLFRFSSNEWNVFLENAIVENGSVTTTAPSISSDKLSATFSVALKEPGDYYQFLIDATNESTLDAMISGVTISGLEDVSDYLECTVTYYDGSAIEVNDILYKHFSNTFKVTLEYKDIVLSQIPTTDLTPTVTVSINYRQANSSAVFKENTNVVNFRYSASQYTYTAPYDGTYKLEVWGGQGTNNSHGNRIGGYGGYSRGTISLTSDTNMYVTVGISQSCKSSFIDGCGEGQIPGGGATHMALVSGKLSELENDRSNIIIVAGGGGGNDTCDGINPSGGGYIGNSGKTDTRGTGIEVPGGTQSARETITDNSGLFGKGGSSPYTSDDSGGAGGGGYYGGDGSSTAAGCGGGGSGYIGNTSLTNKIMYCYNCQESTSEANETHIKTRSTTNISNLPISNYAKIGTGHARITLVSKN